MSEKLQRQKEVQLILKKFNQGDWIALFDKKGKSLDSVNFAKYIISKDQAPLKDSFLSSGGLLE